MDSVLEYSNNLTMSSKDSVFSMTRVIFGIGDIIIPVLITLFLYHIYGTPKTQDYIDNYNEPWMG